MKCLCCNKELKNGSEYECRTGWHIRCIKTFFGTRDLPELDLSEDALEKLANSAVNKGLTVPGVQKKLSLHLDTTDHTSRLTVVDYPAGYILKPASEHFDFLPESEHLVMSMASVAGIKTVPGALIRVDESFAYITKRIDRSSGKKFAMEDFCQLAGRITADKYKGSYENCGKIIRKYVRNPGIDCTDFFNRIIFCFVTGNSDMHYKNFSLIESSPGNRDYMLSAAYDLLPVNIIMPSDTEETALTLNGKKRNLHKKDFIALAENMDISRNVATNLITRCVSKIEIYIKLIEESILSDEMKHCFKELIRERCGRIS